MTAAERIPVLMYHRVGTPRNEWESRYCVTPERFSQHMHRLQERGMRARSLTDFFAWLRSEIELPSGSFLLTFDDGFLGVYERAVPVLRDLEWPATIFLVSQRIGGQDEWTKDENPSGTTYPLLGRKHIEAMQSMGFTFQSHTRLHPDLTTLSDHQLADELDGSRRDLEELFGESRAYLAYPYGRYDDRVIQAARTAGYQAAFSTQPGFNRRGVDSYRIRRLDVYGTDTPTMLARKVFFGSNDGSWRQPLRYYLGRLVERVRM